MDLLFDDGVQYTAPVTQVRKRVSKKKRKVSVLQKKHLPSPTRRLSRQRTATTSKPPLREGSELTRERGRTRMPLLPPCPPPLSTRRSLFHRQQRRCSTIFRIRLEQSTIQRASCSKKRCCVVNPVDFPLQSAVMHQVLVMP